MKADSRYTEKLDTSHGDLYTIEDWKEMVKAGICTNYDGSGYWVKDGYISKDEVFVTHKLDATHVIWYNK